MSFDSRVTAIIEWESEYARTDHGFYPHGIKEMDIPRIEDNTVAWLYGRDLPYPGLRSETFPSARDMHLQLEHFVSGKKHGRVDGNKTKAQAAVAEQRRSFCFAYLRGKCSCPEGTCKYEHREPRKDECRKCGRRGHQEKDCRIKRGNSRKRESDRKEDKDDKAPSNESAPPFGGPFLPPAEVRTYGSCRIFGSRDGSTLGNRIMFSTRPQCQSIVGHWLTMHLSYFPHWRGTSL